MPKLKTNRAAAKRFGKTARGRFKRWHSHHRHLFTGKRAKRKRHLRRSAIVHGSDVASVRRLVPYA